MGQAREGAPFIPAQPSVWFSGEGVPVLSGKGSAEGCLACSHFWRSADSYSEQLESERQVRMAGTRPAAALLAAKCFPKWRWLLARGSCSDPLLGQGAPGCWEALSGPHDTVQGAWEPGGGRSLSLGSGTAFCGEENGRQEKRGNRSPCVLCVKAHVLHEGLGQREPEGRGEDCSLCSAPAGDR